MELPKSTFSISAEDLKKLGPFTITTPEELAQEAQDRKKGKKGKEEVQEGLEGKTSLAEAKEILGNRVFGPEEIGSVFGTTLENVPPIPFTPEQLEQAKEKGLDLILYTDTLAQGKTLTGLSLTEHFANTQSNGTAKILNGFGPTDWKRNEPFFTTETPSLGWKLVSKEIIPNSTSKNYFEPTKVLATYVRSLYNDEAEIPKDIAEALDEFELLSKDPVFAQKVVSQDEATWKTAAHTLANLKLTSLFKESFIESLYRMVVVERVNQEQLLKSMYSFTKTLTSGGSLVYAGGFDANGAGVDGRGPGPSSSGLGVVFSAGKI